MGTRKAESVAEIMDQEQTRLDFVLVSDTIHVNADSLLHKATSLVVIFRKGNCAAGLFLCQFEMKVNGDNKTVFGLGSLALARNSEENSTARIKAKDPSPPRTAGRSADRHT